MNRLLIHATVVTMNPHRDIIDDGAVYINNDRIQDVGTTSELLAKYSHTDEVIDCTDRVIIPGLVNTHTHLFQTLLKGLGDDRVLKDWFTCMTGRVVPVVDLNKMEVLRIEDMGVVPVPPEPGEYAARFGCVAKTGSGLGRSCLPPNSILRNLLGRTFVSQPGVYPEHGSNFLVSDLHHIYY